MGALLFVTLAIFAPDGVALTFGLLLTIGTILFFAIGALTLFLPPVRILHG